MPSKNVFMELADVVQAASLYSQESRLDANAQFDVEKGIEAIEDKAAKLLQETEALFFDIKKRVREKLQADIAINLRTTEEQVQQAADSFPHLERQDNRQAAQLRALLEDQKKLLIGLSRLENSQLSDTGCKAIEEYLNYIEITQRPNLKQSFDILSDMEKRAPQTSLSLIHQRPAFLLDVIEMAESIDSMMKSIPVGRDRKFDANVDTLHQLLKDVEALHNDLHESFGPALEQQWEARRNACIDAVQKQKESLRYININIERIRQPSTQPVAEAQVFSQKKLLQLHSEFVLSDIPPLYDTMATILDGQRNQQSLLRKVTGLVLPKPLTSMPPTMELEKHGERLARLAEIREYPKEQRVEVLLNKRAVDIKVSDKVDQDAKATLRSSLIESLETYQVNNNDFHVNAALSEIIDLAERNPRAIEQLLEHDYVKGLFAEVQKHSQPNLTDKQLDALKDEYRRHQYFPAQQSQATGAILEEQHISYMPVDRHALREFVERVNALPPEIQDVEIQDADGPAEEHQRMDESHEQQGKKNKKSVKLALDVSIGAGPATGVREEGHQDIDPEDIPKQLAGNSNRKPNPALVKEKNDDFYREHPQTGEGRQGPQTVGARLSRRAEKAPLSALSPNQSDDEAIGREKFGQHAYLQRGTEKVGRNYRSISPDLISDNGTAYFKTGTVTSPNSTRPVDQVMYLTRSDQGNTQIEMGKNYRISIEKQGTKKGGSAVISEVREQERKPERPKTPRKK